MATILDSLTVDARRSLSGEAAENSLLAAIVVDVFEIEGMNVSRNISIGESAQFHTGCRHGS
jgi:hypothetical protein